MVLKLFKSSEKVLKCGVEKDGEDQLARSCEKWNSVAYSQGGEEYPTYDK